MTSLREVTIREDVARTQVNEPSAVGILLGNATVPDFAFNCLFRLEFRISAFGDGTLIKTYLSSLIDDHSRFIVQSEFYDNQRQEVVLETVDLYQAAENCMDTLEMSAKKHDAEHWR